MVEGARESDRAGERAGEGEGWYRVSAWSQGVIISGFAFAFDDRDLEGERMFHKDSMRSDIKPENE